MQPRFISLDELIPLWLHHPVEVPHQHAGFADQPRRHEALVRTVEALVSLQWSVQRGAFSGKWPEARLVEVVQVKQGRDALDQALARQNRAQYALSARVESLSVVRAAPTNDARDGARTAAFHVRDAPYTVDADVTLRPPPDSGAMQLRIALVTVPMRVRVTCQRSAGALAGQPSIVVETPRWAHVALRDVSQDPEVCTSARKGAARGLTRLRLRPVIGIGRVLAAERSAWGAFVGVGLTL